MCQKCFRFIKNITVEPAYCLYIITFVIVDTTYTNLLLQKTCRLNCTSEPDLSTPCDDEKQGILFASEVNSFYRFGMFFLCTIYTMLAMSWSDMAGRCRKPLILIPIIGLFLQSLVGCLHTYFWSWSPLTGALSNIACEVMSGGVSLLCIASTTYMCDVTDAKNRTMGLGLLSVVRTFGDLVGFGSSGFILRTIGFFYTFVLCAVLSLCTLILGVIFIKDVSIVIDKKSNVFQCFNYMRIVDSVKVVYKKSLGFNRIIISMLFAVSTLVFFTTQGESSVQYLFLRYKFHWNERDYSAYVIYRYIGIIIGNIFCSIVLSKKFQIHDGLIGVFAGVWDLMAVIGYFFASQNWHLYIVPIFDIFHGTALTVSWAFYTKYYTNDEFGRLHSFLGFFGLIIPSCYPVYNEIFQKTLDFLPSAYFILSIALDLIIILLYWESYLLCKKFQRQKPIEKEEVSMLASK